MRYAADVTGEQIRAHRELRGMLARARARDEERIRWIDAGCPELTEAEYEAVRSRNFNRRKQARKTS